MVFKPPARFTQQNSSRLIVQATSIASLNQQNRLTVYILDVIGRRFALHSVHNGRSSQER